MNRDPEPQHPPVILEGEIIAPGPSSHRHEHGAKPRIRVVKLGWFGKTVAVLAMLAIFAAAIVLAAGALLILLPLAIIGAAWGWWRIRKLKN